MRVEDYGPGIPPRDLDRLFEEFYRAEENGGVAGYGLGLPVARRIAQLLGGDLVAESQVGRGSAFTLWLPGEDGGGAPPRLPGAFPETAEVSSTFAPIRG